MIARWVAFIALANLALLLSGCTGRAAREAETGESSFYTVQRGDTLYSIAWQAGQDYREVARWNGIRPPYVIKPGQQLRLAAPGSARGGAWTVKRGDTLYSISRRANVPVGELARLNGLRPPYTIVPGQRLKLGDGERDAPRQASSGTARQTARHAGSAPSAAKSGVPWRWPARGSLLARFDSNGNKGIDIAGKRGDPVLAAAPGTVVYLGSGLRGYGKLIIIKHSSDFLSAYAHCDRTYVQEGNVIKGSQKIADMGSTGTKRVMLHFEIRYRGIPVDPLKYLPKT